MILGLPLSEKTRLENIHFLCCSNMLDALTLADPLVESLLRLKEGVNMYDALLQQTVVVVAPVLFVMADNPTSSDLCSHQGHSTRKYCRICLVMTLLHHYLFYYSATDQVDKALDPNTLENREQSIKLQKFSLALRRRRQCKIGKQCLPDRSTLKG